MKSSHDEKMLIKRAQAGDKDAFQAIFEKYKSRVFSIAYDMLRSSEDAEDVLQEVFVKAYFSLKNFRQDSSILTWLYRIAYNLCVDYKRKKFRRGGDAVEFDESLDSTHLDRAQFDLAGAMTDGSPQETLMRKERAKEIQALLGKLSEEHRRVIVLREIDGLSYEEIADVVGISKGTVMSRLHYARKHLQDGLKEYAPAVKTEEPVERPPANAAVRGTR